MKRISTSFVALMALFATNSFSAADEYSRIVDEATTIQSKSTALLQEAQHYVHTRGYGELVAAVSRQERLAARVQAIAVREGDIYALESTLDRLDAAFHRVECVFDTIEAAASQGNGHVHGNTRHVKELLKITERCIHKMQRDVKRIRKRAEARACEYRPQYNNHRSPYHSGANVRYATGYRHGGLDGNPYGNNRYSQLTHGFGTYGSSSGLTFGTGNLNFRIGF